MKLSCRYSRLLSYAILMVLFFTSCTFDEEPQLASVQERQKIAINDLRDLLIEPINGWKLDYRPTNTSGSFFILLDFDSRGNVRVRSDVGEFNDEIIPYRIDVSQGVELIFETFTVFHFLFQLDGAAFGGEFEFIFKLQEGNNLIFESKTDNIFNYTTEITLEPADTGDPELISAKAESFLRKGIFHSDGIAGLSGFGTFNIYSPSVDQTISILFDTRTRSSKILGIASGQFQDEITLLDQITSINMVSGYGYRNDLIVFDSRISLTGTSLSLEALAIGDTTSVPITYCDRIDAAAASSGSISGLGDYSVNGSLFQVDNSFGEDDFYVGSQQGFTFIYDENDEPINDRILEVFPDVVAFQWYHEFPVTTDSTFNGVGFVTLDEFNEAEFYIRNYEFTKGGNFMELDFTNNLLPEQTDTQLITEFELLIDEIFSGNEIYMVEIGVSNNLFEFYNPCNQYKGIIF